MLRLGEAGLVWHGGAGQGVVRLGMARLGKAGEVRWVESWRVEAVYGRLRQARQGEVGCVTVGSGKVCSGLAGVSRYVEAWCGALSHG